MKKFFLIAAIALIAGAASAQEPDLEAIAAARKVKADSLSLVFGKVYGTQAAMNHPSAEARKVYLKAFNETLSLDSQDEEYAEGVSIAEQFYRNAEGINKQLGINMNRKAFAQAFLTRLIDTTSTKPINDEIRDINVEAKRLMDEVAAIKKDSVAALAQASVIDIKADSLSQNMGRFFGAQLQSISKKKNRSEEKMARLIEGFNNTINIDESNKPLIDGKLLASNFSNLEKNIKKQLTLNINKETFVSTVTSILNDPKVPTADEFKALDTKTQAYIREVQEYVKENSAEALAQKGLGKKYIEKKMEQDPGFVQSPSGLVYKILDPGKGENFKAEDKVRVMYKGTHVDGTTFDESKEPIAFSPSQVVPGFREALLMMRPGAKMIAVLPYDLAYGSRGAGQSIKPFETLVFEIETLGIEGAEDKTKDAAVEKVVDDTKAPKKVVSNAKKNTNKKGVAKKTSKRKK